MNTQAVTTNSYVLSVKYQVPSAETDPEQVIYLSQEANELCHIDRAVWL